MMVGTINIPFALGQTGLFLTAFFGIAIIHIMNQQKARPPWYHVSAIWIVAVGAVFAFSDPLVIPRLEYLPFVVYLFRFAVGLAFLAGYWRHRYGQGRTFSKATVRRVNQIVFMGCALGVAVVIGYWRFGNKLDPATQSQIHNLQNMAASNRKIFTRDTVLTSQLKHKVDEQNRIIEGYKLQIANLSEQLKLSTDQVKELKVMVQLLSKSIKLIGRQQTTLHQDMGDIKSSQGPQKVPPPAPKNWAIPPDRVDQYGPKRKPQPQL